MFLQQTLERPAFLLRRSSSFGDIAVMSGKQLAEVCPFEFLNDSRFHVLETAVVGYSPARHERHSRARQLRLLGLGQIEVMSFERVSRSHGDGPLNHTLQLSDIAGPGMAHQLGLGCMPESELLLPEFFRIHIERMTGEKQDILFPVTQRR